MATVKKRPTKKGEARYVVRYRSPTGEPRKETFRTRREAEQRVHTVEADKVRGSWIDPRRTSRLFGEIAEEWFTANPTKRSSTRLTDRSILDRQIKPTLERVPAGAVTPRTVQGLVNEWTDRMSARTVRRCYDVLRAVCNYSVHRTTSSGRHAGV